MQHKIVVSVVEFLIHRAVKLIFKFLVGIWVLKKGDLDLFTFVNVSQYETISMLSLKSLEHRTFHEINIFWEGNKIWSKTPPTGFEVSQSMSKPMGRFFFKLCGLLRKPQLEGEIFWPPYHFVMNTNAFWHYKGFPTKFVGEIFYPPPNHFSKLFKAFWNHIGNPY